MSLPVTVIRAISSELNSLVSSPPEGIQVFIDDDDITCMEAEIMGPVDTPFEGGKFRMRLQFGEDYPQKPPKGFFLTTIFHPNVSERGEICVNTLKRDWEENLGIRHILLTVKCLLIVPNPESSLNEEAGRLLLEQYDDYFSRAKLMTRIHAMESGEEAKENIDENIVVVPSSKKSKKERLDQRKKKTNKARRRL
eukprot:TRINITY_DN11693_c0_g1_i1.p1 TRINITY_DN11693_c0_g1~~TRINITY_DN11693_c0_g1_i1.p1  ORF type:complete len:207 (+),score=57.52 TRINITY_DN11693_c0_g1_i1:39-623(+)